MSLDSSVGCAPIALLCRPQLTIGVRAKNFEEFFHAYEFLCKPFLHAQSEDRRALQLPMGGRTMKMLRIQLYPELG